MKHSLVKFIWKRIDKLSDSKAEKTILPKGVEMIGDIPYKEDGTKFHLLDIYRPEANDGKLPVIIYIHGGGFIAGDKLHTRHYGMTLAKEGYMVFNINYRLAPKHQNPAQIKDVLLAMDWIKVNCIDYGGDRNKVVLAGDSAGAYLAALAASVYTNEALAESLKLDQPFTGNEIIGTLLFSGLYDLESGYNRRFPSIKSDIEMLLGTLDIKNYKGLRNFSVTDNVTEKFPPTFISSGEVDGLHQESVELVKALKKNNVYFKALLFDKSEKKAFHCYQQTLDLPTSQQCFQEVIEFLKMI